MKYLFLVLLIVIPCLTTELISVDEIGSLFSKHVKRSLTAEDDIKLNQVFELMHGSINSLEELSSNRLTLMCVVCRSTLQAFFESIHDGTPEEQLIETFTTLCVNLGIMTQSVCHGAVKLNMPILRYIVENEPAATPGAFCGLVLQSGSNPDECPITDPRFQWTVDLPPPPTSPIESKISAKTAGEMKVALIADAHLDPLYEASGVANCDAPTCCRVGQKESVTFEYRSYFDKNITNDAIINKDGTIMMDLRYANQVRNQKRTSRTRMARNTAPAGFWGDYRNCDTPIWAFDDVIERIAEAHKDVDMVYYLGDTIDHGVWETTYELINDMNAYIIDKLQKELGPNIPVIPILGNHEGQPTNQFAPARIVEPGLDIHWLYEALAVKWGHYLDNEAKASLLDRGEFSLVVKDGLRVISLNNNVAYGFNWWLVYDPQDSKRHLDWLVEELSKAELAGEKVHILTHIASGSADLTKTWSREYNRIINRFSSIIAAEFNGHNHGDEFRIFYNQAGVPTNMAWIVGAATSYTHYNLNYKIATFDSSSYELLNFENYIYNLTEANLTPHRRPHWFQLYNFRNSYNLESLSPANMDGLVTRMATTDRHLLQLYSAFQSKLSDNRWPGCNDNCRIHNLCQTVITELWVRQRCEALTNLFNNYSV